MEHLPSHRDTHTAGSRNTQTRHVDDVENNSPLTEPAPTRVGASIYQHVRKFACSHAITARTTDSAVPPSSLPQTKECCLVCIHRTGRDTVAMRTPCPQSSSGRKDREDKIYRDIKENILLYYGIRRFLPFYGVRDVQEVNAC
jgi:hypothetical protein